MSPSSGPSTRSSGRACGPTTCTSSPRSRSAAAVSSPMKLAPITTTRASPLRSRDQRSAVVERAQIVHVRQVGAGYVEAHDARAGREQERIEGHTAAVGHRYRAALRIEGGDATHRAGPRSLSSCRSRPSAAGSSPPAPCRRESPSTGSAGRKGAASSALSMVMRAAVALAPQHLGCRVARRAAADDDDRPRRRRGCRALLRRLLLRLLAHEDLAVGLLDLPARDRVQRRGSQRFARAQAEARVVPGAAHRVIDQQPFGERAVVVRADGADGEDLCPAPRQQHGFPVGVAEQHGAVGEARRLRSLA